FGNYVKDRASSLSEFRAVSVGGDAELLDDLVAELIRRAIPAPRLGKEGIIVVRAIHQKAVLKPPRSAKRQIAVRIGGETARSWVTPGVRSARSVKRLPFSGKPWMACWAMTCETSLPCVSTASGCPRTVTVCVSPASASRTCTI